MGLGPVGRAAPNNVVILADRESHDFGKSGRLSNLEKRWYYYGNVPDAADVAAPYRNPSASPTKLGPAPSRQSKEARRVGSQFPFAESSSQGARRESSRREDEEMDES